MEYTIFDNDQILDVQEKKYVLRIKDMDSEHRPREKMSIKGPGTLSSPELLAIILNTGTKKEGVLNMAQRVLREYGEKTIATEMDPRKIEKELGIPISKACQIIACFEIGRRYFDKKDGKPRYIRSAKQAIEYFKELHCLKKEQLHGLYLNSRYQIIYEEVISIGSLTSNIIHPREVFGPALEHSAVAVILAHNHPSNDPRPTSSDIETTKILIKAGKILGIDLLDHLVITKNKFASIIGKFNDEK